MKNKGLVFIVITLVLLLLTGQVAFAQDGNDGTDGEDQAGAPILPSDEAVTVPGAIPVQGRLTNASGMPLNGDYGLTFSLYEVETGGTAICSQGRTVTVTNGLFNSYLDNCYNDLSGQKVWMGVQVGSDPEMTPRQVIMPVPYAITLKPGALISGTNDGILTIEGLGGEGGTLDYDGLSVYAHGGGEAVQAYAENGYGLYGESSGGIAIGAGGTGIIQSTAQSSIWISGNGVHPYRTSDTTVIDLDPIGGAKIYPGTTVSNKYVMLPITVSGPLYGQPSKVVAMDIYYQASTDLDGIASVILRRQTGVCTSCYVNLVMDTADYVCPASGNPTGCTVHYDMATNNILNDTSGILYLTIELAYSGSGTWVDLGGVRLVLEHD